MRRFLLCLLAVLSTCWLEVRGADEPSRDFKTNRLQVLSAINQAEVSFYGQLRDQHGEALPSLVVPAELECWDAKGQHYQKLTTTADARGCFAFTGLRGARLFLMLVDVAPGYFYSPDEQGAYQFSPLAPLDSLHHPNAAKPEVIQFWKKAGPVSLVEYDTRVLRVESQEVHGMMVDLAEFQKDLAGDLRVQVTYGPEASVQAGEYSWRVKFSVDSGGLVRVGRLRYPFLAPESGYEMSFEYEQKVRGSDASSSRWSEDFEDYFYVKSREGKLYGYVKLAVSVNKESTQDGTSHAYATFQMSGVINENGSRCLENLYPSLIQLPRRLRSR